VQKQRIRFVRLDRQYESIRSDIDSQIQDVLKSGHFILGPKVKKLEKILADYLGVAGTIGLASGSDALFLSLKALDIGEGDEVITTPHSFFATASAIARIGATPVFCDIDKETYNLDPLLLEKAINEKTKAIIPVHIYGNPADMSKFMEISREYNIPVIEDCAQAIGSSLNGKKIGSIGRLSCFSFFPTKNLGAYGDGGFVASDDIKLLERIRALRVHGAKIKYYHEEIGINSRLDEIQAAILIAKLPYLDEWNNRRIELAEIYKKGLHKSFSFQKKLDGANAVYHLFVVMHEKKAELMVYLKEMGIDTGIYYPEPLHLQKCFKYLGYKKGDFPFTEMVCNKSFALPLYPELKDSEIMYIVDIINKWIKNNI